MKRPRFSEGQIIVTVKQSDLGISTMDICRKFGISQQTFYRWKKQYGGLSPSELRRLKELERENTKLKQLVADLSLDKQILQEVLSKKQ